MKGEIKMTYLELTNINGMHVSYPLEEIKNIKHGTARKLYDKSDLEGNNIKPNESLIIINFKDGSEASFSNSWTIMFS